MKARLINLLVVAVSLILQLFWARYAPHQRALDLPGVCLLLALNLPLVVRLSHPMTALIASSLLSLPYLYLGYEHSVVSVPLVLCVYSAASHYPRRKALPAAAGAVAVLLYAQHVLDLVVGLVGGVIALFITLVTFSYGEITRRLGESNAQLAERNARLAQLTERLRREQEERARQAVALEQGRIARELHDVVAHHMAVISVQAGVGRYAFDSDAGTAKAALDVVAETAHQSLSDMRRLLDLLRVSADEPGAGDDYAVAPGLRQLPELLDRVRTAGASVELVSRGEEVPLNRGLDLCVYRVIQESLTNVIKHADPPVATVELVWEADQLHLSVLDQGAARPPSEPDGTVHHGLIGMRERARIYGGSLSAGPRPAGGFAVAMILPLRDDDDEEI